MRVFFKKNVYLFISTIGPTPNSQKITRIPTGSTGVAVTHLSDNRGVGGQRKWGEPGLICVEPFHIGEYFFL